MKLKVIITALALSLFLAAAAFGGYVIGYDETKSLISDQTMMTYESVHGTQVEYIAPNGKTYLLYPGNEVIVKGSWKLTTTDNPNVFNMCFKYPTNSYNPATGQTGGSWECRLAGFYLGGIAEHLDGDVLGLSKQTEVPFVLSKRKTTLAKLIAKLPD